MAQSVVEIVIKATNQARAGLTAPINDLNSLRDAANKVGPAFGAAATAAAAAVAIMVKRSIDAADGMYQLSQRTGESVEFLSGLKYAAEQSDTSVESLQKGMKGLAGNMAEAAAGGEKQAAMFETLGVKYKNTDGTLRSTGQVLLDISEKFKHTANGAEKNAIAVDLFGKAGEELIPMLNEGRASLDGMAVEADALGAVFSTSTAASAAAFNDNLDKLTTAGDGLANSLMSGLMPALEGMSERAVEGAKSTGGLRDVLQGTGRVLGSLVAQVFAFGETIVRVFNIAGAGLAGMAQALAALANRDIAGARDAIKSMGDFTTEQWQGIKDSWYAAFDPAAPAAGAAAGVDAVERLNAAKAGADKEEQKRRAEALRLLKQYDDAAATASMTEEEQILRTLDLKLRAIDEAALSEQEKIRATEAAGAEAATQLDELQAKYDEARQEREAKAAKAAEEKAAKQIELEQQVADFRNETRNMALALDADVEMQAQLDHNQRIARIFDLRQKGADSATIARLTKEEDARYEGELHKIRVERMRELIDYGGSMTAGLRAGFQTFTDSSVAGSKKVETALKRMAKAWKDAVINAMIDAVAQAVATRAAEYLSTLLFAEATAAAWAPAATAATIATAGGAAAAAPAAIGGSVAATQGVLLAGIAHDGLDRVDRTGTYLLKAGEMVANPRQAESIRQRYAEGGGTTTVVVQLDSAPLLKAVGKASRDGRLEIDGRSVK